MPCNSDYMEATLSEITMGQALLVHDEVTKGKLITPKKWRDAGYDKRVYNMLVAKTERDRLVREVCDVIKGMSKDKLGKMTLEAQMWWRDHKAADKKRGA